MLIMNALSTNTVLLKSLAYVNRPLLRCVSRQQSVTPVELAFAAYENSKNNYKEPPFVILHGLFGSKQNWNGLCRAYSQKIEPPRKVIALDLRNHGDSVHSEEHTYTHLSEDIRHFLSSNNIQKIVLMGHSMGGRCAMLFALTYPELLEKLIVVDISPFTLRPHLSDMPGILEIMHRVELPKDVPLSQARSIVDNQLAQVVPDKAVRSFLLTNLVPAEDNSYKWRVNIATLMNKFHEIFAFPEVNGANYKQDTLFIGGEKSTFMPILKQTIFTARYLAINVRNKTDLAQTQNYKSVIDLAYASYQSTDIIFGKVNIQEIPTPLLILHGILGSKSNFNTLSKRYHEGSKPRRLIYAVDLRNHGDSGHSKDNTYDDLVMDILHFLKTTNLKRVSVLGHDVGGRVGMLLSLKYPEIVEKLIVTDISPISTSHNFKIFPEILQVLNNLVFPPNLPLIRARVHVINCLSRLIRNKGFMSLVLMNLVQQSDGSFSWRCNNRALLEHFQELSSFPNVHNVNFHGPVLFIGGAKSDYIQKSDYPKILKLFPKAELKYIEGAGHWVHAEKPNEFLKLTLDFLNKKENSVN